MGAHRQSDILDCFDRIDRSQVPAADFHMHTTWTDGKQTVTEMHGAAVERGLKRILFSEHARRTSADWFGEFANQVRALPSHECNAYVGVETKIDSFDGALDISADVLEHCDLVMASVHRFPGESGNIMAATRGYLKEEAVALEFALAMSALNNPAVDILGHPFGMCYRRFGFAPSVRLMTALIREAARTGVSFEVNCHYHPDPWSLIDLCRAEGARVTLGSNAHSIVEVGRVTRVLRGQEKPWTPSGLS